MLGKRFIKKAVTTFTRWKVLAGDEVIVIAGREKGKKATVSKVLRKENKVLLDGLNLYKRHLRPQGERKGTIITKEMPLQLSNVSLIDPEDGKPTRVGWSYIDGERVRVSKRTGAVIEKPKMLKEARRAKRDEEGPKDTPTEIAHLKTFDSRTLIPRIVNQNNAISDGKEVAPE